MVYYNEIDPYAAQWLRNLIAAGHIAKGEVDERSIQLVDSADLADFAQCHFFAGIGVWSHALRLAGWPDDKPVWTGSCPCQPFSTAGKQLGDKDERHLWPVFFNLIKECRPEYVFGEQVASAIGKGWLDGISTDLGEEGYACGSAVLGAHSVGAPHIRQRLHWVAHPTSGQCEELRDARDMQSEQSIQPASCDSASSGMADSEGKGRFWDRCVTERSDDEFRRHQERKRQLCESKPQGLCAISGLGNSIMSRCEARDSIASGDESRPEQSQDSSAWSNCTVTPCRDGKARRIPAQAIIEPVLQHVVDGFFCSLDARRNILSAAQGFPLAETIPDRVALLKGAGNAIVPQVAAEFIQAFNEVAPK